MRGCENVLVRDGVRSVRGCAAGCAGAGVEAGRQARASEGGIMLINANALHIPLASKSVHTIVTSPPYYGIIKL